MLNYAYGVIAVRTHVPLIAMATTRRSVFSMTSWRRKLPLDRNAHQSGHFVRVQQKDRVRPTSDIVHLDDLR
jgi:hypothetical protein